VFDLKGVGWYAAQSVGSLDLPPIMGVTLYGAFFIVVFSALSRDEIKQIVDLELSKLKPRLDEHAITLTIDDNARDLLAEKGYDPVFGARPLKRLIQQVVEDQLSEGLLSGKIQHGDTVVAEREGGEVSLRSVAQEVASNGDKEPATVEEPVKETAQPS